MYEITAKSVYSGIAIGKIKFYDKKPHVITRVSVEDTDKEIAHMIIDGLTQEQISDKLGISQQAISKRINNMKRYFN